MIFKIQKPLVTNGQAYYLIYNKNRTIVNQSLEVGENKDFDKLFKNDEYKIYAKGYMDKKGRLILSRRVAEQNW